MEIPTGSGEFEPGAHPLPPVAREPLKKGFHHLRRKPGITPRQLLTVDPSRHPKTHHEMIFQSTVVPPALGENYRTTTGLESALIEGTVETVEAAAFDGATCLLTFHHIPAGDRLATLRAIRDRLKPGAGLALVEHAAVGPDPQRWMTLSAAFRQRGKPDFIKARADGKMMIDRLSLGVPAETEALLRVTGFEEIALFYAAFSFRGWFARVP